MDGEAGRCSVMFVMLCCVIGPSCRITGCTVVKTVPPHSAGLLSVSFSVAGELYLVVTSP